MGLEQEIPGYIYKKSKDGGPIRCEPDDSCPDHACDALRYSTIFLDRNDWQPGRHEREYPVGSYGKLLGHADVFMRSQWLTNGLN
jgi:hypothetical protein